MTRATIEQALWSTTISGIFGLFLGLGLGRLNSGFSKSVSQVLYIFIPYGIPTVVAGMAWVAWLGRSGILARWGFHLDIAFTLKDLF